MAYKDNSISEIINELGEELKIARNMKGYTIRAAAEKMEEKNVPVSYGMLSRIEAGERRINDEILIGLCELYDVSPYELTIKACAKHLKNIAHMYEAKIEVAKPVFEGTALEVNVDHVDTGVERRLLSYEERLQKLENLMSNK